MVAALAAVQGRGSSPLPTELIKTWIFIVASSTTTAGKLIPTGRWGIPGVVFPQVMVRSVQDLFGLSVSVSGERLSMIL